MVKYPCSDHIPFQALCCEGPSFAGRRGEPISHTQDVQQHGSREASVSQSKDEVTSRLLSLHGKRAAQWTPDSNS